MEANPFGADPVWREHLDYIETIRSHYSARNRNEGALAQAIAACEAQIALAPRAATAYKRLAPDSPLPVHTGFEQLAVIREKEKNYEAAIQLSKEAMRQGWTGEWQKRIERCEKRLSR